MAEKINYLALSDQDLLVKIKANSEALGEVYKRCKTNSVRFMQKMTSGSMNDYELDDVFHDAMIVLYEKIVAGGFELTCALQTYLNSVCRFQLLNKLGKSKLSTDFEENTNHNDDDENPMSYKSTITDSLDEIEDPKEAQFTAVERALELMKTGGGKCYDLLTQFWYHKKSMIELAEIFDYSNDKTAKKQKSKCQDKLRNLAYNELNQ